MSLTPVAHSPTSGVPMAYNGPSLADHAAFYLLDTLARYGNTVSDDHETALRGLLWLAEALTTGELSGRYRFGLPCGMGKTTAVRAFIRAAQQTHPTPYKDLFREVGTFPGLVVACSKVEQLCALKRQLIVEDGLPTESIGLMHSYLYDPKRAHQGHAGYASERSEGHDRPVLLVTHANVKAGHLKPWMANRKDSLMFFDESLVVSEALTIPLLNNDSRHSLAFEVGGLTASAMTSPELTAFAAWAKGAIESFMTAVRGHENDQVLTVGVPEVSPDDAAAWRRLRIVETEQVPNLTALLKLAETSQTLRVFTNHEHSRALLSYTVTVPDDLRNVIVLDASDPIRELVHHDRRMQRAEDVVPSLARFKGRPGGLASTKRNDRVTVYFAQDAGGRGAMRKAFSEGATAWAIEKLVRLIRSKPSESFLIFTYKDRDGVQYSSTLLKALTRAGIDLSEGEHLTDGGFRHRICVSTWGMETATNEFKHCENVVLLGVIFQPRESVAGSYLGQVDDLKSPSVHAIVHRLVYAECVHSIYQAANRGAMRVVDVLDGQSQAKPCSLYVIHRDPELRDKLDVVMPGARWQPWREPGEDLGAAEIALLIEQKLKALADDGHDRVPSRRLKADIGPSIPTGTWQRARIEALGRLPWRIEGQSLVLLGFTDETA